MRRFDTPAVAGRRPSASGCRVRSSSWLGAASPGVGTDLPSCPRPPLLSAIVRPHAAAPMRTSRLLLALRYNILSFLTYLDHHRPRCHAHGRTLGREALVFLSSALRKRKEKEPGVFSNCALQLRANNKIAAQLADTTTGESPLPLPASGLRRALGTSPAALLVCAFVRRGADSETFGGDGQSRSGRRRYAPRSVALSEACLWLWPQSPHSG